MAYIILTSGGFELDRLKLIDPVLIGRSAECDLPVRDVLMSRRHCRLEPHGRNWRIIDLQSKNGTHHRGNPIQRRTLEDGDELRLGRTTLQFFTGEFQPALNENIKKPRRPADPFEALAGTVSGMVLDQESAEPAPMESQIEPFFSPSGGTQTASVELLVRSAPALRPAPTPIPRSIARQCGLRRPVYRQIDDISLQVVPQLLVEPEMLPATPAVLPAPVEWRLVLGLSAASAITILLVLSGWLRAVFS